ARQQSFARARLAKNQNGWEPVRSWSLQQAADGISKRDDTAAAPKKLIEMQHGGDYSAADAPRSGGEPDWPRSCYAVRRLSHDQDSEQSKALCARDGAGRWLIVRPVTLDTVGRRDPAPGKVHMAARLSNPIESLINDAPPETNFAQVDVAIVGSGYGGSIAATRLAGPDRRVVILERGREYA